MTTNFDRWISTDTMAEAREAEFDAFQHWMSTAHPEVADDDTEAWDRLYATEWRERCDRIADEAEAEITRSLEAEA